MHIKTDGLVLREAAYKDYDKILTVLTRGHGKLTVNARAARRQGGNLTAVSQPLVYSEMVLFEKQGKFTLDDADPINLHFGLRNNLERFTLAEYFCELADCVCAEGDPQDDILRLLLWAFAALEKRTAVKAAFELRLMDICGFMPEFEDDLSRVSGVAASPGAFDAARYILSAELPRCASFELNDGDFASLSALAEQLTLANTEHDFESLRLYRKIKG